MDILKFFVKAALKGMVENLTDHHQVKQLPRPMITAITIKLYRDQARNVQEQFFPYLDRLCESKIQDAGRDWDQICNCRAVQSLYLSVKMQFDKKLLTSASTLSFKFSFAEALTFYKLLMGLPISGSQVYLITLRQLITDYLFKQLSAK